MISVRYYASTHTRVRIRHACRVALFISILT
ncbi:hypothetical protein Alsa3_CDS0140 [Staphylococcus phage Alsa_3]|nr:hypothetical protein Alsa3_CDS0140 [Staphylococcus phage Alsa_3]WNM51265.1 hypothetical protein Alsa4_CDS0135 [Staphylococcus phage Alsa_4]